MGLSALLPDVSTIRATLLLFIVPSVSYLIYRDYQHRKMSKGHPLPPGPSGWPIIGNALEIPVDSMGPVYAAWTRNFGSDIISASALGTTIVVINSYDVAIDLLEKRASKYSCRPPNVMARELLGWTSNFALTPYSDEWRERRKLFVKYFRSGSSGGEGVHTSQTYDVVNRLLVNLSETPSEVYSLVRHMVGSLGVSLVYGLPIQRRRDDLIEFLDHCMRTTADLVVPGSTIVDVLPWIRHIPSWIPGMGFKRFAKSMRWMSVKFKMEPYEKAVKAFGTAGARSSFLSDALAALDSRHSHDTPARWKELDAIQDVASTAFGTAGDTTTDAILTFIYAIATHPDVRRRIQKELDSLLLSDDDPNSGKRTLRLPTLGDQDKLPILMAAVMESQRWAPVAPIGIPHRTTEDDVYNGYFIPKGSVVIANQWAMLNDERVHGGDVLEYNPDRFLRQKKTGQPGVEINPDIRNPNTVAFGFGRRICPGSHMAQCAVWLTAACLLTIFDFEAPPSEKANYVNSLGKVDEKFDAGFLCHPKKFKCDFMLRSEEAKALIGELGMGM